MLQAGRLMELEAAGKRARAASSGALAVDRLSALPDCLLHEIMSYLKARQVVQTCVLSTRWTHLWRSVPSLNLDMEEFKTAAENNDTSDHSSEDSDDDDGGNSKQKQWKKFEDFTDHLLIPNNISIALLDAFRLHVTCRYGKRAAKWIRYGMKYNAQVPGIPGKGLSSSPWRVKRLHLSNVQLDSRFTDHVSSGCQHLEYLELNGCECYFHEIISHSLKHLILRQCGHMLLSEIRSSSLKNLVIEWSSGARLIVSAPAVADLFLALNSYYAANISYSGMPSLINASIRLSYSRGNQFSKNLIKVLGGLCNMASLHVLCFHTMVLSQESTAFPNFEMLKTLLLNQCDLSDDFKTLEHFMKNSPNLENLTLRCCKFPKYLKKRKGKAKSKTVPSFKRLNMVDVECKNLKLTEIIHKDDVDVHQLVELLSSIFGYPPQNNINLTKAD